MSEEEFFNRLLNKIAKEFGYDVASTLELMFMTKDKEIDRLNNIINKLEEYCWELKAMGCREGALDMLDKIEELKNGDNNE